MLKGMWVKKLVAVWSIAVMCFVACSSDGENGGRENGLVSSVTFTTINSDGNETISKIEYEYDSNGNLKREIFYHNGVKSHSLEYDSRGNLTKRIGETRTEIFEYDFNGDMTKHTIYDNGVEGMRIEYQYDSNRNETTRRVFIRGALHSVGYGLNDNKYDSNGNLIENTSYSNNPNGTRFETGRTLYEYDSNGNLTKLIRYTTINYSGGVTVRNESGRILYEYDSRGNLTKQTSYNASGVETHRTEYEYNSRGNETKRTTYTNGVKTSERTNFVYTYIAI